MPEMGFFHAQFVSHDPREQIAQELGADVWPHITDAGAVPVGLVDSAGSGLVVVQGTLPLDAYDSVRRAVSGLARGASVYLLDRLSFGRGLPNWKGGPKCCMPNNEKDVSVAQLNHSCTKCGATFESHSELEYCPLCAGLLTTYE